jgi:hypothetical protein
MVITISIEEYGELIEAQRMMDALFEAGVNNWEGWDFAMELLEETEVDEDE